MRVNVKPFFFGHRALIINISAPTGSAELSQRRIRFDCVGEVDNGLSGHGLGVALFSFLAPFRAVGACYCLSVWVRHGSFYEVSIVLSPRAVVASDASQRFVSLMTFDWRCCYAEVSHGL